MGRGRERERINTCNPRRRQKVRLKDGKHGGERMLNTENEGERETMEGAGRSLLKTAGTVLFPEPQLGQPACLCTELLCVGL